MSNVKRHPAWRSDDSSSILFEMVELGPRLTKIAVAYEWVDEQGVSHVSSAWSEMDIESLTLMANMIRVRADAHLIKRIV